MALSYVAVGPICMETSRSGTVPHIGPLSGPGICVCNSSHDAIIWRAESRTHLSKQTRPSTEHSREASNVRGIPSRLDDQLRWVLISAHKSKCLWVVNPILIYKSPQP